MILVISRTVLECIQILEISNSQYPSYALYAKHHAMSFIIKGVLPNRNASINQRNMPKPLLKRSSSHGRWSSDGHNQHPLIKTAHIGNARVRKSRKSMYSQTKSRLT